MNTWTKTLIASLLAGSAFFSNADVQPLDNVAVIVNDDVVLQSQIDSEIISLQSDAQKANQVLPAKEALRDQVIERLIVEEIQFQEATRLGIRIDDDRLNQAIADIAQKNEITLEQLRQEVADQGLEYATFRDRIRKQMMANEARNTLVRRRINILPAEVDNLAQMLAEESAGDSEYRLRSIQIAFDDNKKAAEALATELKARIDNGEDFTKLAYEYSKGPRALNGGDWGWMRKEEMPTIFADQIQLPKVGEVIGPFASGVGLHLLKIEEVKGLQSVAVTEFNSRHILIKPTIILSNDGAQKELADLRERILSGELTFAQAAEQFSDDAGSASQQGNLGYQTADTYVPEFKYQIENQPVGKISEPFRTVHGWHIVEVLDKRQVDRTEDAMKNRAYRILFNRKFNEEVGAWIQEIRAGAYVEKLRPNDESS